MRVNTRNKPSILLIDDEPDDLRNEVALDLDDRAITNVVHPHDIEMPDLEDADLVLVDYRLDSWPERDAQSVSLKPSTGMALAVMLREHVDRSQNDRLTAFALHTGHLVDIQGRLSSATAQHVLACLNNLEWVFPKSEGRRYKQMALLADAVRQLPSQWPKDSDDSTSTVAQLLALDEDVDWRDRCWHDVLDCRVPIHELTAGRHGILFIRWLLHQVLPYPCFLWADHWVAARLGITVDALHNVLEGNSVLAKELESMRYSGILAGFLGDRWWRGALEDYVWVAAGHTADGQQLREELTKRAGMDLEPIDANPAVVCVDKELRPTNQFLSPMTAVTLRPDHWPPFADSAWIDIETVRDDSTLLSMVDPLDQHRVEDDE